MSKVEHTLEDRYIATLVLHAIGDMIGFKNGDWEFNYDQNEITIETTLELLFEFIALGGINGIDFTGWHVSDDTIYNIAIGTALLKVKNTDIRDDEFYNTFKFELVNAYNKISELSDKGIETYPGKTTNKYIEKFDKHVDARTLPYDQNSGGNGAAMRSACIGLALNGISNRDKLIEISIVTGKLTHNSAIGYLGGLTVSLFVAFAIENIPITKWPSQLIQLLESDLIKKHVNLKNTDEKADYELFISYWQKYIDSRFIDESPINTRANTNLLFRSRFYQENFTTGTKSTFMGESGFTATIMAYDSLLDSHGKWEPLVIYSAIHFGDSDTVGAIAGALYGAVYGFGNVPINNYATLEYREELYKIGKTLYKKYSK
jgi:ADP-ribosylglycohydrolase